MVSFKDCGLQTRLYMLVFAAVVPVFGAVAVHAVQDRREALEQAGRDLQKLAHAIAFDYRLLVDNDRQFLSASSDVPQNFRKAVANRDSVASAVRVNRTPSAASIDLGLPNAPAANAVSMAWIAESLGRVRLPESAQLLLLGRDGMVISRYAGAVGASAKSFADPSLYRNLPQQPEHGFTHVYGAGDAAQLIGFAPLSSNGDRSGARVLIAMPLAAAYAEPQRRLSWNLGFLTGMTLLMFAAVRWFGSRWVLQPVDALTRAVERFGGGDLSARTGLSHDAGELGRLARGVDALVERAERQAAE
ncbi:MAG TPA: HAMP domain-containing protein [Burkholderiales bacterium]|nr:HAMP domain-containing protein [Burkholderiales bacterium]